MTEKLDTSLQLGGFEQPVALHDIDVEADNEFITLTETYKKDTGLENRLRVLTAALESLQLTGTTNKDIMKNIVMFTPDALPGGVGLEHFSDEPSRLNYKASLEGILGKIKNALVWLVKKIIETIRNGMRWISDRTKEFFGYKPTAEMISKREQVAEMIKADLANMTKKMGVVESADFMSFLRQIEEKGFPFPDKEDWMKQVGFIQFANQGLTETIAELGKFSQTLPSLLQHQARLNKDVVAANEQVRRTLDDLRNRAKRGSVFPQDLDTAAAKLTATLNFSGSMGGLKKDIESLLSLVHGEGNAKLVVPPNENELVSIFKNLDELLTRFQETTVTFTDSATIMEINQAVSELIKKNANENLVINVGSQRGFVSDRDIRVPDAEFVESMESATLSLAYQRVVETVNAVNNFNLGLTKLISVNQKNMARLSLWSQRWTAMFEASVVAHLDYSMNMVTYWESEAYQAKAKELVDQGVKLDWDEEHKAWELPITYMNEDATANFGTWTQVSLFNKELREKYLSMNPNFQNLKKRMNNFLSAVGLSPLKG